MRSRPSRGRRARACPHAMPLRSSATSTSDGRFDKCSQSLVQGTPLGTIAAAALQIRVYTRGVQRVDQSSPRPQ